MVSAAREARYIPGGIRETSRRVDRTVRALVEKAKIAQRPLLTLQRLRYAHAAREASRPMSAQPVGTAVCTDVNPLGRPACPFSIDDPKHWLERAKEARALAEQIDDPEVKRIIRQNADDYEQLAKRAEERSVGRWPKLK